LIENGHEAFAISKGGYLGGAPSLSRQNTPHNKRREGDPQRMNASPGKGEQGVNNAHRSTLD